MISEGTLLDGRVRYAQARSGYRTGIEPVLLAAFVPAQPGDCVLEAGTGAGAGLLCLAARCPDLALTGVEKDEATAALARDNLRRNGLGGATIVTADLLAWTHDAPFDHAFANPPWHSSAGTASPDARRDLAKRGDALEPWVARLGRALRRGGSLTLVLAAGLFARACAAMEGAALGRITLLPLLPRVGHSASLVLLRAAQGSASPAEILPPLVLHAADGTFTREAERILRGGEALPLA